MVFAAEQNSDSGSSGSSSSKSDKMAPPGEADEKAKEGRPRLQPHLSPWGWYRTCESSQAQPLLSSGQSDGPPRSPRCPCPCHHAPPPLRRLTSVVGSPHYTAPEVTSSGAGLRGALWTRGVLETLSPS